MKEPDKNPEVVPDKITSRFDFRAFAGIIALVISFHVIVNYVISPENTDTVVSIFSFLNPLIVTIIGFSVVIKYRGTLVFGKSYLALSLGFLSIFLAEVTYMIYDIVYNIEPYPSIADIFFFMLYPCLLIYLFLNIRFFSPKISKRAK
ncbi:MAG: histidine kinase, partial [Nitrosopumilus sp.]